MDINKKDMFKGEPLPEVDEKKQDRKAVPGPEELKEVAGHLPEIIPGEDMDQEPGEKIDRNSEKKSEKKAGCRGESKVTEILNILNGAPRVFTDKNIRGIELTYESERSFLDRYARVPSTRSLSVREREGKMNNEWSRLFKKRNNAKTLQDGRNWAANMAIAARRKM